MQVQLWSAAGHEAIAVRRINFSVKKHKAEKGSVCPENKMRKRKDTEREEIWSLQLKPGFQRREWGKQEKKESCDLKLVREMGKRHTLKKDLVWQ